MVSPSASEGGGEDMRGRKSFPAIFAQTIEREISALEATGSLWRLGRDRSLEHRSAGLGTTGYTAFRIMTGFPTLHSLLPPSSGSTLAPWAEFSIHVDP